MRIKAESEILDIAVRKRIIEEIEGPENLSRKADHYRRQLAYKDAIPRFVRELLELQLLPETVQEMSYCLSNIAISRKVVDKLARVYSHGAKRTVVDDNGNPLEDATTNLNELEKELDFNTQMKTQNRILKLHRNAALYIKPCPIYTQDSSYYSIRLEPLAPYLYDVVEQFYDRTKPLAFVLSNYSYEQIHYTTRDPGRLDVKRVGNQPPFQGGDGKDQAIADKKEDENSEKKQYIWWTENYHFTTDETGEILPNESGEVVIENPIKMLPIIPQAVDRAGSFWAEGGNDLTHGAILINSMITHVLHIGVTQGYGQFWMRGKNPPRNVMVGPNRTIIMEQKDADEPTPEIGFESANPPLDQLRSLIEMYVSLYLTTNNLSTSGVKMDLSSSSFPSGISLMLDKAESMEDVKDQEQMFLDLEPMAWQVIGAFQRLFSQTNTLDPKLEGLLLPQDADVVTQFPHPDPIISETEKLTNIEKRKTLGLNTAAELLQLDQPHLTKEQADQKLMQILEEKANRLMKVTAGIAEKPEVEDESEGDDDEGSEDESGEEGAIDGAGPIQ